MVEILLLEAKHIKKYFGDDLIFTFPELSIYEGDRIGLVGVNGSGKTTLLRILSGQMDQYEGKVTTYGKLAYFEQFGTYEHSADKRMLREWGVQNHVTNTKKSGGEITRLRLAETFSKGNHIVFLDEPTTNLDLSGVELLKKKMSKFKTFVLVSHDIELLNTFCTKIIEIREKQLNFFNGNYNDYQQQVKLKFETAMREYEQYVDEKRRLEKVYRERVAQAETLRNKPRNVSNSEYKMRNFVCVSKSNSGRQKNMMKRAKAVQTRIEQMEEKEKPVLDAQIKLDYRLTEPPSAKIIVRGENVSFSYSSKRIFQNQKFMIRNGSKVAIIGDNGCGKSTLMNMIYNQYEGIKVAPDVRFGLLHQEFENLDVEQSVYENVLKDSVQDKTTVRSILARVLFGTDDINKKISVISGGEKIKVSLAKMLVSKVNVLMLDEPTNYLDSNSVQVLIELLQKYKGTIIFVSHDRAFINQIATDILLINKGEIISYEGNLAKYEQDMENRNNSLRERKILLEMRLVELNQKLLMNSKDKEEIEKQYFEVAAELREIENREI